METKLKDIISECDKLIDLAIKKLESAELCASNVNDIAMCALIGAVVGFFFTVKKEIKDSKNGN